VMHQERNMGESIISTCMNITDKTKDNPKARKDLALICRRPTIEEAAFCWTTSRASTRISGFDKA
jgi:hypothetical protein